MRGATVCVYRTALDNLLAPESFHGQNHLGTLHKRPDSQVGVSYPMLELIGHGRFLDEFGAHFVEEN